jgi:type IV secretory pathway VirB4 component
MDEDQKKRNEKLDREVDELVARKTEEVDAQNVGGEIDKMKAEVLEKDFQDQNISGEFLNELRSLINRHSRENASNTPDFLLAEYLLSCLKTFEEFTKKRDRWYGVRLVPGNSQFFDRKV